MPRGRRADIDVNDFIVTTVFRSRGVSALSGRLSPEWWRRRGLLHPREATDDQKTRRVCLLENWQASAADVRTSP